MHFGFRLLYFIISLDIISIVDEPYPIRVLAADCPIFFIFQTVALKFISSLCCGKRSSKEFPAIHMVLLELYPSNPRCAASLAGTVLQKIIILSIALFSSRENKKLTAKWLLPQPGFPVRSVI